MCKKEQENTPKEIQIKLKQTTINLSTKTKLGYKGHLDFSDGWRLVACYETDGFGNDLRYNAGVEKKTEKDGIIKYDVSHGIICMNLEHMEKACQQFVDKKLSEGVEIIQ